MWSKMLFQHESGLLNGLVIGIGIIALTLIVRLLSIIIFGFTDTKCPVPAKTMAVLGSGGHTREMIAVMKSLSTSVFTPRVYVYSKKDILSKEKAETMEESQGNTNFIIMPISRSRDVGQSYITSIFTTAYSLVGSFLLVSSTRPDIIICTGPGVCVPIIYSAVLLKFLGLLETRIIFVESICRVKSLSLTGRLVRPVVNAFIVQWEEMKNKFKGTECIGRVC